MKKVPQIKFFGAHLLQTKISHRTKYFLALLKTNWLLLCGETSKNDNDSRDN